MINIHDYKTVTNRILVIFLKNLIILYIQYLQKTRKTFRTSKIYFIEIIICFSQSSGGKLL